MRPQHHHHPQACMGIPLLVRCMLGTDSHLQDQWFPHNLRVRQWLLQGLQRIINGCVFTLSAGMKTAG